MNASGGLVGHVAAGVGREIVDGTITPGSIIDREHVAVRFGASRSVVREAFNVLAAKGLIESRPHVGTSVRPRRSWRLTDPDVMAWRHGPGFDRRLVADIDELRSAIEPLAAKLAARRADGEARTRIRAAMDRLRAAAIEPGSGEWVTADVALHREILHAAGNELLASLESLLEPALRVRDMAVGSRGDPSAAIAAHETVVRAIEHGRDEAARRAMARLIVDRGRGVARDHRGGAVTPSALTSCAPAMREPSSNPTTVRASRRSCSPVASGCSSRSGALHPAQPFDDFVRPDIGGWDEMVPTCVAVEHDDGADLPDHGEVWSRAWVVGFGLGDGRDRPHRVQDRALARRTPHDPRRRPPVAAVPARERR